MKVDLTKEAGPEVMQLMKKYDVQGVPAVIFLDSSGLEMKELEIVDYVPGTRSPLPLTTCYYGLLQAV